LDLFSSRLRGGGQKESREAALVLADVCNAKCKRRLLIGRGRLGAHVGLSPADSLRPLTFKNSQPTLVRATVLDLSSRSQRSRGASKRPSAFENVAAGWVALAEQVERIDAEKSPVRDQENNGSVR